MSPRARQIAYWIPTALGALAMLGSAAANLSGAPEVVESIKKLGMPTYLPMILGTWKLLGALTILAPKLPRLKEWAYAGFTFLLTGAFISHLAAGDPVGQAVPSLVILAILLASWALRPEGRKLEGPLV